MVVDRLKNIDDSVYAMERNGILVDTEFCRVGAAKAADDIAGEWFNVVKAVGQEQATAIVGLPPQMSQDGSQGESPKALAQLLHTEMGLAKSPYWKKGKVKDDEVKCDAVALGWLARTYPQHQPLLLAILALRKARGCYKYLNKLPGFVNPTTGRVHPIFGAASADDDRVGAVTGRLAVKLPELQQIPKDKRKDKYRIRKAFSAAPGNVIIEADYTALEVVILAHVCQALFQSDDLAKAIQPGAPDIHGVHALAVYRDFMKVPGFDGVTPDNLKQSAMAQYRDDLKTVWYGLQYGKGAYGFGYSMFDERGVAIGEERAGLLVEGLLSFRPAIRDYQQFVREFILRHRGIPSLLGRWSDLSDLVPGKEWAENRAWRKALNFPMQAGGADIVGLAMGRLAGSEALRRLGFRMILQVHDALMFEGPESAAEEAKALISLEMTRDMPLSVPLQAPAHHGLTWEDCH